MKTALAASALLLIAALLIWRTNKPDAGPDIHQTAPPPEASAESPQRPSDDVDLIASSSRTRKAQQDLQSVLTAHGLTISADRITKNSAEGSVRLMKDDGTVFKTNEVKVSPGTEDLISVGPILITSESSTISMGSEGALVRLSVDGSMALIGETAAEIKTEETP